MRDQLLFDLFVMLVRRLPMLLLFFGAMIWAIVRWKVHPRASLMVLIASFIYLLGGPFFTLFFYEFPAVMRILDVSTKTYRWLYSGVYFFENFILAAIILLIVGAAFSDRSGSVKANT
ncbi:MAG TPA: hypothetical protein VK557_08870 [Pyrinomonadaceae bacterium]|nr:hypothetical protein [Pyrinomonadaceae bacterium]